MNELFEFRFPPVEQRGDVETQLKYAAAEIVEAAGAHHDFDRTLEIMDAIDALEGAMAAVAAASHPTIIDRAYREHYRKNRRRGYYDHICGPDLEVLDGHMGYSEADR